MYSSINCIFHHKQIADFGMARDVADDNYYVTTGGKIPLKWTSPEVADPQLFTMLLYSMHTICRQYFTKDTQHKVMCGALDV